MNISNIIKTSIMTIILVIVNILFIIGMSLILDNFILGNWYNAIFITIGMGLANILMSQFRSLLHNQNKRLL